MILNATGYIVAAHKIQVAAKVIGKVKWIGVDKGDRVSEGEVLVRLEDDEYQAQLQQAQGPACQSAGEARRGDERVASGRGRAGAGECQYRAEPTCDNAKVTLERTKNLAQGRRGRRAGRWTTPRRATTRAAPRSIHCRRPMSW